MRIEEIYSHLNGYEYLQYHKPNLWNEIESVLKSIDANIYKTKISKEKTMLGKKLFSPIDINKALDQEFAKLGWNEERTSYWVTKD